MEESPLIQSCPTCGATIDISEEYPLATIACPACGAEAMVDGRIGHFELQEIVGRGGMGVVYKAYDGGLDRFVALKLLRIDKTADTTIVQQMATEAAITASINHPHVVRVFTTGTDRGRFYIAMELVDKGTLDQLIQLQGRVGESQVLQVGSQIAQGLRAAQMAGLIHRDVKPGNILFADSQTAKIVDFGLAIFMEDEEKVRGEVWGTPYYVAPEKLENLPEDFRSDIYSLGGTLFHALAGRPPFEAEDASMVALKHLKSQAVSLQAFAPHISSQTAYVINRTLAKDPNDRYQSYDELIEHLDFAREQLEHNAANPQHSKRVVMEDERSQQVMGWVTLGMFALLLLGGIGAFVFRKQIFGQAATPRPSVAIATPAVPTRPEPLFPEALVPLSRGEAPAALALYRQHARDTKLPAVQQAWANCGEALAAYAAGRPDEARGALQTLLKRRPYSTAPADEKTADWLVAAAQRVLDGRPIALEEAKQLESSNHEAIGGLLFGLREINQGRFEEAAALLRQFRQTAPVGRDAWIAELKPLATEFLEDLIAFQMGTDRFKKARTPQEREAALVDLQKLKAPFQPRVKDVTRDAPPLPAAAPATRQWSSSALGKPAVPGQFSEAGGTLTIKAAGADIWGKEDAGHFAYRKLDGDGVLIARVVSIEAVDPWSKGVLMIRENLEAGARNVAIMVSVANGASQQLRATAGALTTSTRAPGPRPPQWLKLERKGDAITTAHSDDGKDWKVIGTQNLAGLPRSVLIGLAATSHKDEVATTVKFDQVRLTP